MRLRLILCFWVGLFGLTEAQADSDKNPAYKFCTGYRFQGGKLVLFPYVDGYWFHGQKAAGPITVKPGDRFVEDMGEQGFLAKTYEEWRLDRLTSDKAWVTHWSYAYTLGPEEDHRRKVIQGDLLKTETLVIENQDNGMLVDYPIWVENHAETRPWQTKDRRSALPPPLAARY